MSLLKILVIDDVPSYLNTIEEILDAEDYRVIIASNAQTAWELFQLHEPDMVLADVNLDTGGLSSESGLWLTQKIKQYIDPDDRRSVILMSSDASVQDQLAGYAHGCDDYLVKPFDPKLLLAKIAVFARKLKFDMV